MLLKRHTIALFLGCIIGFGAHISHGSQSIIAASANAHLAAAKTVLKRTLSALHNVQQQQGIDEKGARKRRKLNSQELVKLNQYITYYVRKEINPQLLIPDYGHKSFDNFSDPTLPLYVPLADENLLSKSDYVLCDDLELDNQGIPKFNDKDLKTFTDTLPLNKREQNAEFVYTLFGRDVAASIMEYTRNKEWQKIKCFNVSSPVVALAISPDSRSMAISMGGKSIHLFDNNKGLIQHGKKIQAGSQPVEALCYSPDGLKLLSGSQDSKVRVWSRSSGDRIGILDAGPIFGFIKRIVCSHDASRIAAINMVGAARIWHNGRLVENIPNGQAPLLAFAPHANIRVTSDGDKINVAVDNVGCDTLKVTTQKIVNIGFSADGQKFFVLLDSGYILYYATNDFIHTPRPKSQSVPSRRRFAKYQSTFIQDAPLLIGRNSKNAVTVRNLENGIDSEIPCSINHMGILAASHNALLVTDHKKIDLWMLRNEPSECETTLRDLGLM